MIDRLHEVGAWAMVLSNAVAGLWCLAAHRWSAARVRWMWGIVVVAQLAVAAQAATGTYLIAADGRTSPGLHTVYGFVALVAVAVLYGYRTQMRELSYLLYGFGCLFLMGMGIRGMVLG